LVDIIQKATTLGEYFHITLKWESSVTDKQVSKVPAIISGILLLFAVIGDLPYGFFQLLRFVVCASAAFLAFQAFAIEKIPWAWIMGGVAVLFNPILPIHLNRDLWQPIDFIAAIVFATSIGYIRAKSYRYAWAIPTGIVLTLAIAISIIASHRSDNRSMPTSQNQEIKGENPARSAGSISRSEQSLGFNAQMPGPDSVRQSDPFDSPNPPILKSDPARLNPSPNYFTLGSSQQEVLAAQGTPTSISGNRWSYDFSSIEFRDGKVANYSNISNNLHVHMSSSPEETGVVPRKHFTIGSRQDDVLAVQGTPTSINGNRWSYDFSSVEFRDGKVANYSNISKNLHVQMSPSSEAVSVASQKQFTIGSSQDEVLAVQRTPTGINGNRWSYDFSSVEFRDGKVANYSNISKNLRVQVSPSSGTTASLSRDFFTIGSSQDEVLAIQETPTGISGNRWSYDFSSVEFSNGKVARYSNISGNLKVR
jgi:hypothetical protein